MEKSRRGFRLNINAKIFIIFAFFLLGLALLSSLAIRDARRDLVAARADMLKRVVETAEGIASSYEEKARKGEVTTEQARSLAMEHIRKLRYGGNEYFWINDMTPRMLMHPFKPEMEGKDISTTKDPQGKPLFMDMIKVVRDSGGGLVEYMWPKPGMDAPQPKLSYVQGFQPWGWVIGSGVYIDNVDRDVWAKTLQLIKISGLIGVVLLVLTLPATISLSRSIRGITHAMQSVADGSLNIAVPYQNRKDEVGEMAAALNVFKENAEMMIEMQKEHEAVERQQTGQSRRRDMLKLADDFEAAVSVVASAVLKTSTDMSTYAHSLIDASHQTTVKAQVVAASSEEASANVATVASATEELTASIGEINRQVADSSSTAAAAVAEAHATNTTMQTMAAAAQKIGIVVQLINDIAAQTNLLALNATIEAARAGDAGKGFAVVANEVKSLATQTAKATDEITQQVQEIRHVADDAVAAIRNIGGTIQKVSSITTAIAAAVEEQGSATAEISRNVQEASRGTQAVSSSIGEVTQVAGQSNAVAIQIADAAKLLSQQSEKLQKEMQGFIATIRAA